MQPLLLALAVQGSEHSFLPFPLAPKEATVGLFHFQPCLNLSISIALDTDMPPGFNTLSVILTFSKLAKLCQVCIPKGANHSTSKLISPFSPGRPCRYCLDTLTRAEDKTAEQI